MAETSQAKVPDHRMCTCGNTHNSFCFPWVVQRLHTRVTPILLLPFDRWRNKWVLQSDHCSLVQPELYLRRLGYGTVPPVRDSVLSGIKERKLKDECERWSRNRTSSVRMLCWVQIEFRATMWDDITETSEVMLAGNYFKYWLMSS